MVADTHLLRCDDDLHASDRVRSSQVVPGLRLADTALIALTFLTLLSFLVNIHYARKEAHTVSEIRDLVKSIRKEFVFRRIEETLSGGAQPHDQD